MRKGILSVFFVFAVVLLLCCSAALSEAFKLPDTGQTQCYQAESPYAEIPCDGTGQDGEYNINPMSYTDNGNGTVTDNNTGLVWQKCSVGQNNDSACSGTASTYNWYQASGTYDATYNPSSQNVCGSLNLGGYSDWRLPSKKELITVVDYSIPFPGPTINTTYFPNAYASSYWSSTTYAYVPPDEYIKERFGVCVDFRSGLVYGHAYRYGGSNYVRCVRGGQYPVQSFVDNGNGTVTDLRTGLMWQKGEGDRMTWGSALSYCENLRLPDNASGYTDWRLPNVKELESIIDDSRNKPAIDTTFFPNANTSHYWSSTTDAGFPILSWFVYFGYGYVDRSYGNKSDFPKDVRCVRGGQSGSLGNSDYFEFSFIPSPQAVKAPFDVTITKKDKYGNVTNYTGPVTLWSNSGAVDPMSINMNNGSWIGQVSLYAAGSGSYLGASTSEAYGTSNSFTVAGSGGGTNDFGNLYVKVYDNRGNPLADADIFLDLNNDGSIEYTHTTNRYGEHQFTHLPSGVYRVKAEFGLQSDSDNTYVPANSLPATVFLTVPIFPSCKTPVILLPGIMGSNQKGSYIIYPQLPAGKAAASELVLHGRKTAGWEHLIEDYLTKNGYEKGVSIIECPYDWRMPVEMVVDEYLKPCIDRAKKATGSEKVNIISHSTGGLVTRAYIQSKKYSDRNDIYRFAMVGTPNRGAVNAYYIWEGGDPLWADNLNESFLGHINPLGPNFYWNTTERMYERTYKLGNLKPDEHLTIWNFIREKALELKDLLPTFDFLEFGSLRYITSDSNKNKTLIDLNNNSNRFERMSQFGGSGTVATRVFYSASEDTIRSHKIYNPDVRLSYSPLYEDGVPQVYAKPAKSPGDGTVWEGSAKLPYDEGWAYNINCISSEHTSLIKNCARELFAFVNDGEPNCQTPSVRQMRVTANATEATANTISILIDGRAQPYIVDPNGLGTGAVPSTGLVANNIPSSIAILQAERANISIENPLDGTYTLYLKSADDQDYYLTLDYIDSVDVKSIQAHGFNHANTTSFTITIDSTSANRITVNKTPLPPTELQADAINSGGLKTRLTWDLSTDPTVAHYNIYSRYIDEPYLTQTGTAATNLYDTDHPWAADAATQTRIYAVSAVRADGTESFLSNMAQNDDRDHDGLTDEQETDLGTNPDNMDTDGDGLTDGKEYIIGTNPLLTDTDGDGYGDFMEVQEGSDPLDSTDTPPDADNDKILDRLDNCPSAYNPDQLDSDGDGAGDACDSCPVDPLKTQPGLCGCGIADTDTDGDATPDCNDGCPNDSTKVVPGFCGCGIADTDSDSDGTADCNDGCPNDPNKVSPGACGCGRSDADTDGDGVADCIDNCPAVSNPDQTDSNGNGIGDACEAGTSKQICSILGNDPKPSVLDQDIFKFRGNKGEKVKIRLEAIPSEAGIGKRATLILTDKIKGTVLAKVDLSMLPNEITTALPATGEYLITVAQPVLATKDKRYAGGYCLTLQTASESYKTLAPHLGVE